MDEIDLKLLRLLQKNARTPIKALAGEVRLSSPAVSARIERLEKQGVIRAYTLDLDPLQLGHHILAYIHLDMQPTQKEEFYPFIAACSNVLECNCVTGNYSMLIKVSFASTQELDGFIAVSYTHLDVYKRQVCGRADVRSPFLFDCQLPICFPPCPTICTAGSCRVRRGTRPICSRTRSCFF